MRTQCEAEELHEAAANRLAGAGFLLASIGPPFAIFTRPAAIVLEAAAFLADQKRSALEEGCEDERFEAGKKAAAAAAAGSGSGGGSGGELSPRDTGNRLGCGYTFVPGSSRDDGNGGAIVMANKWVWKCSPIVLDLDGDGFDYRPISSPVCE